MFQEVGKVHPCSHSAIWSDVYSILRRSAFKLSKRFFQYDVLISRNDVQLIPGNSYGVIHTYINT